MPLYSGPPSLLPHLSVSVCFCVFLSLTLSLAYPVMLTYSTCVCVLIVHNVVGIKITVFTLQWVTKFQLKLLYLHCSGWQSSSWHPYSENPFHHLEDWSGHLDRYSPIVLVMRKLVMDFLLPKHTVRTHLNTHSHHHHHAHIHTTNIIIIHTHTHTHLQSMSNRVKDWGFRYFDIICLKLLGLLNFAFESWSVCTQCFYF